MPLPASDTPWPPTELAKPLAEVALNAAWYSGDRRTLAAAYGRQSSDDRRPSERRWFWGRQNAPALGQRDHRLHIPLAADIATTSADLLFSEPPTFEIADEAGTATQDRLDVILEDGGIANRLLEAAEVAAALGGVYLKADWDLEVARQPLLGVVHADAAVPEFRWGRLVAVTFWREVRNDGRRVWRHLERHEVLGQVGMIEHGLYEGTTSRLGSPVPLTEDPSTAGLVDGLVDGTRRLTGLNQLTADYIPNMRPNRTHRGSDLGRSDYQGTLDLHDALDETWTSWMRDLRLGRARLVIPEGFLQAQGKGHGAAFDADREVYAALSMPPSAGGGADSITSSQFAIRVEEHARTAQELVARTIATAGYSAQTFGLAGDVAITATEVDARQEKSKTTRGKKTRYWKPALARMGEVLLQLDVAIGTAPPGVTPGRPQVTFTDFGSPQPRAEAETFDLLRRAQSVSTQTLVARLHPEWDQVQVAEEVGRIQAENGTAVPDPAPDFAA